MGDQTADNLAERMQSVLEPGRDAEVAAAPAQGPEEVRMGFLGDVQHLAVRGHQLDGEQVVDGEAVDAVQPAEPAAERESGDSRRRDDSARGRQPVQRGLLVELAPRDASLCSHGLRGRIDVDALHLGEVDHQTAFCDGSAGHAVPAAAYGDLQPRLAREGDRVHDVCRAAAPRDQRGTLVDQAVVDPARLLVALVPRIDDLTGERRRKRSEPLGVDGCRCRHACSLVE